MFPILPLCGRDTLSPQRRDFVPGGVLVTAGPPPRTSRRETRCSAGLAVGSAAARAPRSLLRESDMKELHVSVVSQRKT